MADTAATNLPRRFGRYEVAATIASPRCADGSTIAIAIARPPKPERDADGRLALNIGPSSPNEATKTTKKPVAIKRIAPALAQDFQTLSAFIETAREISEIRHQNIADVSEVHHDGGEIFLVMDWLMGETAASLIRRLHSQGERLRPTLAAYLIAEACAGLEAAHSRGVIHAHLTPHDIFIGYDGSVYVLDIGIAAARRKLAGGRIAGVDIEYASPELCRNETLDRRSDVFSLGTIMWELLTGLSPFERANDVETMRAICDEPAVPPKNIVPGLPKELSTVTVQALARDRGGRHQTAAALRGALLETVKKHGGTAPQGDQLGQLMHRTFEAREKDKREMFRRVDAGTPLDGLDVLAIDRSVAPSRPLPPLLPRPKGVAPQLPLSKPPLPTPDAEELDSTEVVSISGISTPARSNLPLEQPDQPSIIIAPTRERALPVGAMVPSSPPPAQPHQVPAFRPLDDVPAGVPTRSGSGKMIVAGLVLLAAVIGLVVGLRNRRSSANTPPAVVDAGARVVAQRDVPPPPPPPPAPSEIPTPPPTISSAVVANEETVLHIDTIPAQATISIGGVKQGVSPMDLRLPKGMEPIVIELRHPGYVALQERVIPDVNQRLKLTLAPARGTKPPSSGATTAAPYKKFE